MGGKGGGTQKWCPYCKKVTICSAMNVSGGQRFYKINHSDIHYFRRKLECNSCYKIWYTVEIQENFLTELTELRDALLEVKTNTEQYLDKSEATSLALENLTNSLNTLTTLKVYKDKT